MRSGSFRLALVATVFLFAGLAEAAMQHKIESGALAPLDGPVRVGAKLKVEQIPLVDGEPATLEVERFEVWADHADIKVFGPNQEVVERLPRPKTRYYRGRVAGEPGSIVFLAVDGRKVDGLIYVGDLKFAIGSQRRSRGSASIDVVIQESSVLDDIPEDGKGFVCGVEGASLRRPDTRPYAVSNIEGEPVSNVAPTGTQRSVINLAVDTDYELFDKAGDSAANVTTYIGNLMAAASTIYERDLKTEIRLAYLGIQNSASDPFTVVPGATGTWDGATVTYTSFHALLELGDRWHLTPPTTNVRSAATLISGKAQLAGIAWVGTLCSGDFAYGSHWGGKYSYNGGITPPGDLSVPDPDANPDYSAPSSNYWPLLEVAHELGHNVGSDHTHCIGLTADQKTEYGVTRNYVDECYNGEGGCFSGTQVVPAEKGTIMSYCHLRGPGYGTNTRFTFGQDGETSEVALNYLIGDMAGKTPGMSAITAPDTLDSGVTGNASVTNAGLSYAWSIVNGTFTGGGTTATGAAVSFSGTVSPITLTVTATNGAGCSVTDTKSITVTTVDTTFDPPANIVATAVTSTSVQVTWSMVDGATTYKVYRSSGDGAFNEIGSTSLLNYTDTTAAANTAYRYTVSGGTSPYFSSFGTPDLATTVIFTDATLTATSTKAKLVHFTELRTAVNAVRTLGGLGSMAFTSPEPTTAVTVRRQHLLDLRAALDEARAAVAMGGLTYTDSTVTAGSTAIKAAHINELRNGVK